MDYQTYCKDLGIEPSFFDPNNLSEFYFSNDLTKCITEIKNSLDKSLAISIIGQNGIGKTTIRYYLTQYADINDVRFLRTHHLDDTYRIEDIYTAISLSINENAKITKKLSDRKNQAYELLTKEANNRNLFIIDNGELIKDQVLKELLKFKYSLDCNFSVLVFTPIKHNVNFDKYVNLNGLSEKEISEYFMILKKKAEDKLPHMISLNAVKHSNTYYEIIENVLRHAWERMSDNENSKH